MDLQWFQNDSKWSQNDVKMVPKASPHIPIPGVSKSLLPGGKQIRKKHIVMNFWDFYEKRQTNIPIPEGLKRGP